MSVIATGSVSDFFQEVVGDAMRSRKVDAGEGTTSYLVCLLTDYTKPDPRAGETLERPLAFLLDEAIKTAEPGERFEKLRTLGDGVLYGCGFFRDHFEKRGVDEAYLFGIGATAYQNAALILRRGAEDEAQQSLDVFGELAKKFDAFVSVIADVADSTVAMSAASSRNVLRMYERWLKTGSDRLAKSLSDHGLVPTRGSKGVLQ